jgi:hypothetical protein
LRVAGLIAVMVAGLSAAALAGASSASAATAVVHAAKSGELSGGRLVLRGVSGRVSYRTDGGRSGSASVRRLQRRVFLPGKPATGTLNIAGQRGDDPKYRLSKPRYNAARRTVSYRAKPLTKKRSSGGAARAAGILAQRKFGAASLSIVPHPTVASGDNGGNDCKVSVSNPLGKYEGDLVLQSSSKWDTDDWATSPPDRVAEAHTESWESDGGWLRGCSNTVTYWRDVDEGNTTSFFTISVTWAWGSHNPSTSCDVSNPDDGWQCVPNPDGSFGWLVRNGS